jgi:hypothetical protein
MWMFTWSSGRSRSRPARPNRGRSLTSPLSLTTRGSPRYVPHLIASHVSEPSAPLAAAAPRPIPLLAPPVTGPYTCVLRCCVMQEDVVAQLPVFGDRSVSKLVALSVFSFLDNADLYSASLVSSLWDSIAADDALWDMHNDAATSASGGGRAR